MTPETKNNNQVPQEQAVHLIKSGLNIFRDEIFKLQCELDKLKPTYIPQPGEVVDYTHLLPAGYEFCTEGEHTHWVKVKKKWIMGEGELGTILQYLHADWFDFYRPIRKIQYHVAVHEAVTDEPNPYAVDWSNAPEWADIHAFDYDGKGVWGGFKRYGPDWYLEGLKSHFTLPTGLDWTKSKTVRP